MAADHELRQAVMAFARKDYPAARRILVQHVRAEPGDRRARALLADVAKADGRALPALPPLPRPNPPPRISAPTSAVTATARRHEPRVDRPTATSFETTRDPTAAPIAWTRPPPGGPTRATPSRPPPLSVAVLAVLQMIGGGVIAAMGLVIALSHPAGLILLPFAALAIAVGVGLMRLKMWAWVTALVLNGLSLLGRLPGTLRSPLDPIVLVTFAIAIGVVVWLIAVFPHFRPREVHPTPYLRPATGSP